MLNVNAQELCLRLWYIERGLTLQLAACPARITCARIVMGYLAQRGGGGGRRMFVSKFVDCEVGPATIWGSSGQSGTTRSHHHARNASKTQAERNQLNTILVASVT